MLKTLLNDIGTIENDDLIASISSFMLVKITVSTMSRKHFEKTL